MLPRLPLTRLPLALASLQLQQQLPTLFQRIVYHLHNLVIHSLARGVVGGQRTTQLTSMSKVLPHRHQLSVEAMGTQREGIGNRWRSVCLGSSGGSVRGFSGHRGGGKSTNSASKDSGDITGHS